MTESTAELARLASILPARHIAALRWFSDHSGMVEPWPNAMRDGTLLATRAKGIYKPAWTHYALSVRQALVSKYPDKPLEIHGDTGWTYRYFQEELDPGARDSLYTNRP